MSVAAVELGFGIGGSRRGVPTRKSFESFVGAALAALRKRRAHLNIRVVGADEARALNKAYRNRDYPTNVLSFPADDARGFLGDIAICSEVVASEAAAQGKTPRAHYAHMTIHGVLHLLGYDHQNDADAATMEALEVAALRRLGIGNPYVSEAR